MAWILASNLPIQARQGGKFTIQYTTPRNVKGDVQMRLIDLTPDNGRTFSVGQVLFELRDSSRRSYGRHWVNKRWGVPGAWTQVGFVPGVKSIRLDVYHDWDIPVSFKAEMRYNNSNARP